MAKRTGKGEKATVIFKRFATQGCSGVEYQSQTPRTEATPFQYNDLQTSPAYCNTEYFNSSLPYYDNGIPWQNCMDKPSFLSNIQNQSTTSIFEGNTDTSGVKPQPSAEKISTIVYSSRLVKDPRLSRQETNVQRKSTEDERVSSVSVCEEQQCQAHSQNQKEENKFTLSYEKQSVDVDKEHKEGKFPKLDDSSKSSLIPQTKTENMPSIKFFKTKFQKYAPYFKMTEEERHTKIWSRGNKTPEQNQLLIDRIHFYEIHHQRYKQGLLFQKDTETDTARSESQTEPQNNDVCPSTLEHSLFMKKGNQCVVNESHMRRSVSADVSDLTPTTVLVYTERTKLDILNTDNDQLSQNICGSKENGVKEKEEDPSSASQTEPQEGVVVQTVKEKENISEMFVVQSTMESKPSNGSKTSESTNDSAQILCTSIQVQINNQDVDKSEIPTSPKEFLGSKPTLSNTIEDCLEFEQHIIAMEVANCVDISATDVAECSDYSYATAMEQVQDRRSSTEKQDGEALTKSNTNSEMSIEVERGEAQHNTIYNALYNRLQLDQLLSESQGANFLSNKSYLRPKVLDNSLVINLPQSNVNEPRAKEENLQVIVKLKSSQVHPERRTLSERFSKLRCLGRKLAAFVRESRLANSYTDHLTGYVKCEPEALISCSDGGKGTGNNNAELIKILAQQYNGNRLVAKCKHLRKKCSKVPCRKSANTSGLSKRTFRLQRKTMHYRKSHLLQAKTKRKTKLKLSLKRSPRSQASFNNLTSESSNGLLCIESANDVDKDSALHLNSATASPSQSDSQSRDKLLNNDDATVVSTEETSGVDSENKTEHGDELSQTKEQCINSDNQSTEMVCQDVTKISNQSEDNMSSDSKDTVIIEEIETDRRTNNNKTSLQEKSSLVTCSGRNESSNKSNNDESAEAEPKEEASLQKKLSQEDNCDTKEISPDYNTGAYEDTSSPVPTVSSIPSDITPGNVISSCTAKTQTAMTPDSPRIINNETDTQAKARILWDSAVDHSSSGLTKRVLSTNKSEVTDKNANLQDRELCDNPKNTDSNEMGLFSTKEMSSADQNYLKALKDATDDVAGNFTEKTNHLSGLVLGSQCQHSLQNTKSSGIMNALVETTSDIHSRINNDAQKDLVEIKDNLQLAWNVQDKNSLPATSDTQIISKLRDYLTKFECTVKKQDTVNNSVTEAHVPTAWITLDSTAHKQQLHSTRHYSRQGLIRQQSEPNHFHVANTKHKQSDRDRQPNSSKSKKRRTRNVERVSPDSTITETVRNEPNSHTVNKDTQPHQTASGVPYWFHNRGNKLQQNLFICPQVLGNLNRSSGQHGNGLREQPCQVNQTNELNTSKNGNNTYIQDMFSVTDISNTLKQADHAASLNELGPLQSKCKRMLQHFISNFEQDQKISFYQSCISRNLILEKYLDHPPAPVELKFEAINSFLELQMIMEACQFVDNKINFLRRKPTFRSLLWYDPSLYGELYKGTVGFQQQSSLFSSFQQCLTSDDYRRLREYYCAVSTLHQQLQDAPDTSYYMYLKTKRERLEIEAAFRNPSDVKSFFLSVPTAVMMNLGDNLEILKKTHDIVMAFIETPADRLPGKFDVGKAEHLSIICRYLQEKILFLKSHNDITKISWFGMEHVLYDASKVLVWGESEQGVPNEVLIKYNRLNTQTVYGLTEACVTLVNNIDQFVQPMDIVKLVPPQQMNPIRMPSAGVPTDRAQTSLVSFEDCLHFDFF